MAFSLMKSTSPVASKTRLTAPSISKSLPSKTLYESLNFRWMINDHACNWSSAIWICPDVYFGSANRSTSALATNPDRSLNKSSNAMVLSSSCSSSPPRAWHRSRESTANAQRWPSGEAMTEGSRLKRR